MRQTLSCSQRDNQTIRRAREKGPWSLEFGAPDTSQTLEYNRVASDEISGLAAVVASLQPLAQEQPRRREALMKELVRRQHLGAMELASVGLGYLEASR